MKEQCKDDTTSERISHIQFSMFSAEEMRRVSHVEVVNRDLYQPSENRRPTKYGVLDRRLGTSEKSQLCESCGLKLQDCVGHYGFIDLALPIFHVGYFKAILQILHCVCKTCSRVLLGPEDRLTFSRRLRNPNLEMLQRRALQKAVEEKCRRINECPFCHAYNGPVKKMGALKIVHERYRRPRKDDHSDAAQLDVASISTIAGAPASQSSLSTTQHPVPQFTKERYQLGRLLDARLSEAAKLNRDVQTHSALAQEFLTPLVVHTLFCNIPDMDCVLLDLKTDIGRPENLCLTRLLVPPVCIRPSVNMDSGSGTNEDDLTMKLVQIIHANQMIHKSALTGNNAPIFMEEWDLLQLHCAYYMNSELSGVPLNVSQKVQSNKPIRGFCQRLKGKAGRFRGNLSGKRVDFSSRTVISPDPNLSIEQVAIPVHVAQILTYPTRVTEHNMKWLQKLVRMGTSGYPGANQVTIYRPQSGGAAGKGAAGGNRATTFNLRYVKPMDRKKRAKDLKVGDLVERHLVAGDYVLFNRQPSLHKLSIMCHRVVISPHKTFSFNECVCTPYNADFDGDEMNLHVPQTEEARAEAAILMNVKSNIVTPRNGEPLISAIQDFITGAFLLSGKDIFFTRSEFCQLCVALSNADEVCDLPKPAILKPIEYWTGKQVFGMLMRPNESSDLLLNLRTRARTYSGAGEEMCPVDGFVLIRNSEHMCGTLDKGTLGSGSKATIFHVLLRDYGAQAAADAMARLAKVCTRFLTNYGFSIGIEDVTPGPVLLSEKQSAISQSYAECDKTIEQFEKKQLEPQPGCTMEETLEANINGELGKIRKNMGDVCLRELDKANAPLIMAKSGSKGSNLNIAQMIACVGQQSVGGARIPNGFESRTLPHFRKDSRIPAAKGFVSNSFYSGLKPTEFFFHTICGREGLVDTAVKTAETGYMQRRLMKALEDLATNYDDTVRNSVNTVVQFKSGEDGLDPASMEGADKPVDFERVFQHVCAIEAKRLRDVLVTISSGKEDESVAVVIDEDYAVRESHELLALARQMVDSHFERDQGLNVLAEKDLCPTRGRHEYLSAFADDLLEYIERRAPTMSIGRRIFLSFLDLCYLKYKRSFVEPGTAVGAIAAQSIGEPGTQMTLKTFHFAGVASMNVTLGVPRVKEIINASKTISTPIIEAALDDELDVEGARTIKGRIEKTLLGEVSEYIQEVYRPDESFIKVRLSTTRIRLLCLDIDANNVAIALLAHPRLKLTSENIAVTGDDTLLIYPPTPKQKRSKVLDDEQSADAQQRQTQSSFFVIQRLKLALPEVLVKGIVSVRRAVISRDAPTRASGAKSVENAMKLIVEGENLLAVMSTRGVNGYRTTSNHIIEVAATLGIEAARGTIMHEIQHTMSHHGQRGDT